MPDAIASRSPSLAASITGDVSRLAWWPPTRFEVSCAATPASGPEESEEVIPAAWWQRVERARNALAREEGWPVNVLARGFRAGAPWTDLVTRLRRQVPDALSVIVHGPALQRGEKAWGDPDVLVVTHLQHDRASHGIETIAAHRIGWLPPSTLQQSLLATGVLAWGEPAALEAVPSWRSDQIDPLVSLAELVRAERLLSSHPAAAVHVAAGALLIAKRGYTPWLRELPGALTSLWPEAPPLNAVVSAVFVKRARELLETWLYHWDASRLSERAQLRVPPLIGASA